MAERPAPAASGLLSRLKQEAKEAGLVMLYFFCCFSVLLLLKKLLLAGYDLNVSVISTAVVAALIIGKVVVILDKTRAGTRFDARLPLGLVALYKTLIYAGATFIVLWLEKVLDVYRESGGLGKAVVDVWAHRHLNLILVQVICIGLAFLAYHLYAGLDRRLGHGTIRRLISSRG